MAVISASVQDAKVEVIEDVAAALYSEWAVRELGMSAKQVDANFRLLAAAASIREKREEPTIVAELETLASMVEELVADSPIGELEDGLASGPLQLRLLAIGYRRRFEAQQRLDTVTVYQDWAAHCDREQRLFQD